jgi:hypothetical protein
MYIKENNYAVFLRKTLLNRYFFKEKRRKKLKVKGNFSFFRGWPTPATPGSATGLGYIKVFILIF